MEFRSQNTSDVINNINYLDLFIDDDKDQLDDTVELMNPLQNPNQTENPKIIDKNNQPTKASWEAAHFHQAGYFVQILQDTYGVVSEIDGSTIFANIFTHNGEYQEDIEFNISELESSDCGLVSLGAIFYWRVGYKLLSGTRKAVSEIRMKRLIAPKFNMLNKKYEMSLGLFKSVLMPK